MGGELGVAAVVGAAAAMGGTAIVEGLRAVAAGEVAHAEPAIEMKVTQTMRRRDAGMIGRSVRTARHGMVCAHGRFRQSCNCGE